MSDVPLLDELRKLYCDDDEPLNKMIDALRKFQKAELFHIDPSQKMLIDCVKCNKFFKNGYSVLNIDDIVSYFYCKDCWFKEVFGVLDSQDEVKGSDSP